MTTEYGTGFPNTQPYLQPADVGWGVCDGASSGSSVASPLYANNSDEHVGTLLRNAYPVQDPVAAEAMGLIPVELDIDLQGLYEPQDRRRKKGADDKVVPPHVHSRRRAQNRASQRAFRDRKESRMKEIEEKLTDLQGQHSELTRSYATLQEEYAAVKGELEALRTRHEGTSPELGYAAPGIRGWEECPGKTSDPLLFDVSAFCYDDYEKDAGQKEGGG